MRLIDADALMEELKMPVLIDNEKASRIWEGWHECTIGVKKAIDRTPTIEERKKGKWELQTDNYKKHYGWYICSECGALIGTPANFCSECGADMRGEKDGRE